MANFNNLCPGCMREINNGLKEGESCPHCGFKFSPSDKNSRCLDIGTVLAGKYLVGKVIGQGGFGITYIGFDLNMETRVAIKEYFPVELVSRDTTSMTGDRVLSLSGDKSVTYSEGLKKYVEEARAVSGFSTVQGIVSVKDFFYENETAYIVMEYIDGISLKDYLKKRGGLLSEQETLKIMKPIIEALQQVHKAGLVHRDISPDNIMLTFKGEEIKNVKLIDFGAARMTSKNDQKSLTIILKHGYAPEEQYRTHGEQGTWTDVYSICATMYRMMTGDTPVPAMDRLFQDNLKTFEQRKLKISKNTSEAIMNGLAVKKEDRIQTMGQLADALYNGGKISVGNDNKKKKYIIALTVSVACIAVVVIVGVLFKILPQKTRNLEPVVEIAQDFTSNSIEEYSTEENTIETDDNLVGMIDTTVETEAPLGEVIVTATPQTSYASCYSQVVYINDDGTVGSYGSNEYGQRELSDWTHIAAVAVGETFTAGLREDGTVLVAGELTGSDDVKKWTNIVAIDSGGYGLFGLTSQGNIVHAGSISYSVDKVLLDSWKEWTGIKAIAANWGDLVGLDYDGNILSDHYDESYSYNNITGWQDVEYITTNGSYVAGVKSDGTVVVERIWSYNDESMKDYMKECDYQITKGLSDFNNITQTYILNDKLLGISEEGSLYITGDIDNTSVSYQNETELLKGTSGWDDLKGIVGYGGDFNHCLLGFQKDGDILRSSFYYGNTDLDGMDNLSKVMVMDGETLGCTTIVGVQQDGNIKVYSTDDLFQYFIENGMEKARYAKEMNLMEFYDYFSGVSYDSRGGYYLSNDGKLYISEYSDSFEQQSGSYKTTAMPKNKVYRSDVAAVLVAVTDDGKVKLFGCEGYLPPDEMYEAEKWTDIIQVASINMYEFSEFTEAIIGLKSDGTLVSVVPEVGEHYKSDTEKFSNVESIYGGYGCVGVILQDGTAAFLKYGVQDNYGQFNTLTWDNLTQLAMGKYHTVGLRSDGTVYACGNNLDGQCDVSDWADIVYIEAGETFTLGVKSDGTLLVAGNVG
jgi:serine/threonine protein kinase